MAIKCEICDQPHNVNDSIECLVVKWEIESESE